MADDSLANINLYVPADVAEEWRRLASAHGHGAKQWAATLGLLLLADLSDAARRVLIDDVASAMRNGSVTVHALLRLAQAGRLRADGERRGRLKSPAIAPASRIHAALVPGPAGENDDGPPPLPMPKPKPPQARSGPAIAGKIGPTVVLHNPKRAGRSPKPKLDKPERKEDGGR